MFSRSGDRRQHRLVNELLDQVEDVYEERLPNLDVFLRDLLESLGESRYLHAIADVVHSFGVYFVLNMFNGVRESYESAIQPFVEYLTRNVSSKLRLTNLGWVVQDEFIHRANCERRPILLQPVRRPSERPVDPVLAELADLESSVLGLPKPPDVQPAPNWRDEILRIEPQAAISRQLEILQQMYHATGAMQVRDNFAYITHRALHLARSLPAGAFGHAQLATPIDMLQQLFPEQKPRL